MKKTLFGAFIGLALVASAANATVVDNTSLVSPGFYDGSGNANQGFTVDTENGVEAGVGVINRKQGPITPTVGSTYDVQTGTYSFTNDFCTGVCAIWNIQFSANVAGANLHLSDINTLLTVTDQTTGKSSSFDPLVTFLDNSGWDTSKNVANINLLTDIGFQNSENLHFPEFASLLFDPNAADTYLVDFSVSNKSGVVLADVNETINATPIPGALPMFASGLGVITLMLRKKKKGIV